MTDLTPFLLKTQPRPGEDSDGQKQLAAERTNFCRKILEILLVLDRHKFQSEGGGRYLLHTF